MHIGQEHELLSALATKLPLARHVLAFAPHPDDEIFGCGGTLCLLKEAGARVKVHILTDGALGGNCLDGQLIEVRAQESRSALQALGLDEPMFWQLPDRGIVYGELLIERLKEEILSANADLVFFPSPTEIHPDHQALAFAGIEALRRLGGQRQAAFYEVGSPLPTPNLLVDISSADQRKLQAMECFRSQLAEQPYAARISALNSFRAYPLGPKIKSAEAFVLIPVPALDDACSFLLGGTSVHRRRLGFASCGDDIPLVSIIVRSMDLPTLDETLDSLAMQTYANLEVIVINARGGEHRPLGEKCGRFPLRLVNQGGEPLPRARAANVGLSACHGRFLGFLDDDDMILPDHVHGLVVALQKSSKDVVVYAATQGVRRNDPERLVIARFAEPEVSFSKLMLGNVIPIHAVLFPASLVQRGGRFDETLDLYEDWDFWLQLACFAPFDFVNQTSAIYYLGGGSEVSPLDPRADRANQAAQAIFAKWLRRIDPQQMKWMGDIYLQLKEELKGAQAEVQRNAALHQQGQRDLGQAQQEALLLSRTLFERDAVIAERVGQIAERDGQIAALNQSRESILASRCWRLTAPVRMMTTLLRQGRVVGLQVAWYIGYFRRQGSRARFKKTLEVFRREGVAGLRHRLGRLQGGPVQPNGPLHRNDYAEWVRRYDTLTDPQRRQLGERVEGFDQSPLISVVMPTYNSRPEWLAEAIESVQSQIYPRWELCIADDASTDASLRPLLERYAAQDPRIKVVFREQNGHISEASNSAIDLASGDWIALLDHDDLLAEAALFRVAEAINAHSEARLIYSDEDKIDERGNRANPYFKCDWNHDLFLSHNLITHLGVYRTDLVRAVGGFRKGVEGAQDYDLAMRCIEQIEPGQIVHIPRILYHWREHSESTAQDADAKPYAMLAGERVLNEHLQRSGVAARAEHRGVGYRVRYELPDPAPAVSLIIPTKNGVDLVRRCVESILEKTSYPDYEILIVDNGSDDPEALRYFRQIDDGVRVRVIPDHRPFNYSALNNAAVKLARGEVVGLLNNDTEVVTPDWLEEMVSLALQPGVGAVGARLWYPNDTLQHGGVVLGIGGWAGHAHKGFPKQSPGYAARAILLQSFSAVTGACLVVRKELYETLGGLDEENLRIACNDVDFCLRLREAGYRNVWTPYAELYHHESATRGYEDTPEKQARFMAEVALMRERWGEAFEQDPAYSPNLTLDHEDFSYAWPPRVEF